MTKNPIPDTSKRETEAERHERLLAQATSGRTITDDEYQRRSRRAFVTGGVAITAGAMGWRWVTNQEKSQNIPTVLRAGFETNERLWRALSSDQAKAREYDISQARELRVNGRQGLKTEIDLDAWTLDIQGSAGDTIDTLVINDVTKHEHVTMVTEHKCIEGWSTIAHWTGVRFADVAMAYREDVESSRYVGLATPDQQYYVGLERAAALHPQTLLAFELDGEPLTLNHGAPLRLVTPNHYGIKSIKRIGSIQFTNTRPADYWTERGYDWYSRF